MKTGIYTIENNAYRAIIDHISVSELNVFAQAPRKYEWEYLLGNRRPPSKSQETGIMIHTYVLEPELWVKEYKVSSISDRRTVKGKEQAAAEALQAQDLGITFISQDTYDKVRFAGDSLLSHPFVKEAAKSWIVESSMFWTDKDTGALCKGRTDAYVKDAFILDVKTTANAVKFANSVTDYAYQRQVAYYIDGLVNASQGEVEVKEFYWATVETEAPYLSCVYKAAPNLIDIGRHEYKVLLNKFQKAKLSNTWPGLPTEVSEIDLPNWYKSSPLEMIKRGEEF